MHSVLIKDKENLQHRLKEQDVKCVRLKEQNARLQKETRTMLQHLLKSSSEEQTTREGIADTPLSEQ